MSTLEEPSVGLWELRHHASEVISRVPGETIVITEHGASVARLVPFERPAILARLEAEGRLRPRRIPDTSLRGCTP